jgi:hypothetical protein
VHHTSVDAQDDESSQVCVIFRTNFFLTFVFEGR